MYQNDGLGNCRCNFAKKPLCGAAKFLLIVSATSKRNPAALSVLALKVLTAEADREADLEANLLADYN
jgi:hypothetical protein